MGSQIGEMRIIQDADGAEVVVNSPVVSLVMFTDDEDSNEANWFMVFSVIVEKSIEVKRGDARVEWAMIDNQMLRKTGSKLARAPGIYLLCMPNDAGGVKLPFQVMSQDAAVRAGAFILDALAAAKAENIKGVWHKAAPEGKTEL